MRQDDDDNTCVSNASTRKGEMIVNLNDNVDDGAGAAAEFGYDSNKGKKNQNGSCK